MRYYHNLGGVSNTCLMVGCSSLMALQLTKPALPF